MRIAPAPSRFAMPLLRGVLAILALVSQLTLGSIDAPARALAADNAGLRSVLVLCAGGGQEHARPAHGGRRHVQGDAAGQPVSLELPASLLLDAPTLPAPLLSPPGRMTGPVRPRAPPVRSATLFRARAPPLPA